MWIDLCHNKCNYVVDSFNQGENSHASTSACPEALFYTILAADSPSGDVGAVTLKSSYN